MGMSGYSNTQSRGERISNFLRSVHPFSTAKLVARDLKVPVRTVEKWLDGTSAPSLDHFFRCLGVYGPAALLAVSPDLTWVEAVAVILDQDALEARLAEMPVKRQRAVDALRGRR